MTFGRPTVIPEDYVKLELPSYPGNLPAGEVAFEPDGEESRSFKATM